ncbi:hypothetical protein WME95_30405 [Sorangium sp. So ce327]
MLRLLSALALAGLAGAQGAAGCVVQEDLCGHPWDPCPVVNPDGTSNGVCWGKCVPHVPSDFAHPMLLWMGPEESEPSCEDLVADNPFTGEPEPIAPSTFVTLRSIQPGETVCGECSCGEGDCSLPQMVAANSLSSCEQIPEATNTPFNPPPSWGGGCISPGTVPSSQVGSIWIGPVIESYCKPRVREVPPIPEGPSQVVVVCAGGVAPAFCPGPGDPCMLNQQEAHLPPGWRYCVVAQDQGVLDCHPPASPGKPPLFSERFLFYQRDLSDSKNCEPCGCASDGLNRCEARVSAYADGACSDSALIGTAEVARGAEDTCLHVEPGPALGSLSAEWVAREDPQCTPFGGQPRPRTVCCLPEPEE